MRLGVAGVQELQNGAAAFRSVKARENERQVKVAKFGGLGGVASSVARPMADTCDAQGAASDSPPKRFFFAMVAPGS